MATQHINKLDESFFSQILYRALIIYLVLLCLAASRVYIKLSIPELLLFTLKEMLLVRLLSWF